MLKSLQFHPQLLPTPVSHSSLSTPHIFTQIILFSQHQTKPNQIMNLEYQRHLLNIPDVGSTNHHHVILIDDDDDAPFPNDYCATYTRPFLVLDMIWNLSFVFVSIFVLLTSFQERPSTPLRVWICGYALQCVFHVGFVFAEYQSWSLGTTYGYGNNGGDGFRFLGVFLFPSLFHNSIVKKLESINTIVSSVWWVFGFYWAVMGGQMLLHDSPRLYWLSVVFLAFDVFFLIFCIAMGCIVFFVLFCFFPIIATVAYAMSIGEGASENDIKSLPKYQYRQQNAIENFENDEKRDCKLTSQLSEAELVLQPEDSECCICLHKYVDGTELCRLPCNHHFHHECIAKWLRINATCPLCKFNILKGGDMLV